MLEFYLFKEGICNYFISRSNSDCKKGNNSDSVAGKYCEDNYFYSCKFSIELS